MKYGNSTAEKLPIEANQGANGSPAPSDARDLISRIQSLPILQILFGLGCALYGYLFYQSIAPYWFHPSWTTDDALQQIFPFHKAVNPGLFANDLVTRMMECYLAPIHYWLGMTVTKLTGSPIMTGHWLMLAQIVLTSGFIFGAVRVAAGTIPAFFATAWLWHTRHIMQRLTAGLPRGWSAPLFAAYLYLVLSKRFTGILFLILIGCLLHPPGTLLIAASHGMFLLWKVARIESRDEYRKHFLRFLACAPVFALLTFLVVRMPPEIGTMASYEVASQMPEFQEPRGRFPFLPLHPAWTEIRSFGFQAFIGRFYNPGRFWKDWTPTIALLSLGALVAIGYAKRRKVLPEELIFFLIATLGVYFASRAVVFKLYVPNRHLQFPLGIFFITAFSIAAWRAFQDSQSKNSWKGATALCGVGLLVYFGSGLGLHGAANFNFSTTKRGHVFSWISKNTAEDAIVAGEPTLIDPVQLFGMRAGYVTTETSHPFYDKYHQEMKRRLEISLRAHYARNLNDLVALLEPEGISYFMFDRRIFTPEGLKQAKYFPPLDTLVAELASRPLSEYAYSEVMAKDESNFPPLVFRDNITALVDIRKLKEYLGAQK